MRRLSLSLFMLALAGLLLVACDPRREQEVDVSEAESAEDCAAVTPVVTSSEAPLARACGDTADRRHEYPRGEPHHQSE